MILKVFRWFLLLFVGSVASLQADGFQFERGRLKGEKVIQLKLTPEQVKLVGTKFEPGVIIKLSASQRAQIKALTGAKEIPTKLGLWRPSDLEHDCSCFLWNIGILFKPGCLELPISRIVSDREAADRQPDPNG